MFKLNLSQREQNMIESHKNYCNDLTNEVSEMVKETLGQLSNDFIGDKIFDAPQDLIEAIQELAIGTVQWTASFKGKNITGITFISEKIEPSSIREAINNCITQYIPDLQAILKNDCCTFILPEDKIQNLLKRLGFYHDHLDGSLKIDITLDADS